MNRFDQVHVNAAADKRRKLNGSWWQDARLWRERYEHTDISRPCEDMALENIHTQCAMLAGDYRVTLDALEIEVDNTFGIFKRLRSGYEDEHYITQTAMRLKIPLFQVRGILKDVEYVKRNYERIEGLNIAPNVINRCLPQSA